MSEKRSKQGRRKRSGCSVLRALTTSALALPGLATSVLASAPVERSNAAYRFNLYTEDAIDNAKVAPGGETSRYEIQAHQFAFEMPVGQRMDVDFRLLHETMTGASPIFVTPDGNGNPLNVMSGATIEEARTDVLGKGNYYFDSGRAGLSAGVSTENDYLSFNVGVDGEKEVFDKMTTLLGGVGVSFDTIEPSGRAANPERPSKETKQSYSASLGAAQVLSKVAAVQSSVSYRLSTGYLSDAYKKVSVGGAAELDTRPDGRHQFSWLTRYRRHFKSLEGSLHADYQLALDSWGITSHTIELAWYQSIWESFRLVPNARYYSQSQADFYQPFFSGTYDPKSHYSSDYRLSPYGAFSVGAKADVDFQGWWKTNWKASFAYERYMSDATFAIGKVRTGNPGLVDFHFFSLNLTGRF